MAQDNTPNRDEDPDDGLDLMIVGEYGATRRAASPDSPCIGEAHWHVFHLDVDRWDGGTPEDIACIVTDHDEILPVILTALAGHKRGY